MTEGFSQQTHSTGRTQLSRQIFGYWTTHIVGLTARLGIADQLADGPKSAADVAAVIGADGPTLGRLMRALTGLGLLTQHSDGRFALTEAGSCLRDDVSGSLRAAAIFHASEYIQRAWFGLEHSIRTGEPAFDYIHGISNWRYRAEHPEDEHVFNGFMTQVSAAEIPVILAAFDFSPYRRVIDVGGGRGHLLAAILENNPDASGVLFDLPSVVEDAEAYLASRGVLARCQLFGGSFFETVPDGGDLYLLKSVTNSVSDESCVAMLSACRRAMDSRSRLLIIEQVMPSGPNVSTEVLASVAVRDIGMLVMQAGRHRTEQEFRTVLDSAGFALRQVLPAGAFSILVAEPVSEVLPTSR